jgi:hypothetical protein
MSVSKRRQIERGERPAEKKSSEARRDGEAVGEQNGGVMSFLAVHPYEALAIETGPASEPSSPMLREEKYHDFGVRARCAVARRSYRAVDVIRCITLTS